MNKKRLIAAISSIALVTTLFAGCASTPAPAPSSTPAPAAKAGASIKIGLSTDEGGLNDKSFNQSADTGVKKAVTDFGVQYKAVESKTKDDYEPNLDALVNTEKSNLVFGVGFQMHDAITNAAKQYPDTKFAIIDDVVQAPNVESITFKEQEGSFLMGVIAGKMTKTNKIGFIGGKNMPLIEKFEAGFTAGVNSVNPEAAKGLLAKNEASLGKEVRYADSFADTTIGSELAKQLYADNCDVVYHAAGGVGLGLFKTAKELTDSGKKVWAIGVDMDQAVSVPEYASIILSSMVKRVDTATYNATKEMVDKNFQGGKAIELGLKEDGVGYAPSSKTNTPADVLALVDKYVAAIKAGTIVAPTTRADALKFVPVAVQ
jgi:basic membrane protein A and related proteins